MHKDDSAAIKQLKTMIKKKLPQRQLYELKGVYNGYSLDDEGRVTGLNLYNCGLTDVSPLAECSQVTKLDLSYNQIRDVSPLTACTRVTTLNLGSNKISDVSPLAECAHVKELYLSNNQIRDVSLLTACTRVTTLNLAGNKISDVSPLAECARVTTLNLGNNQINDVSPLCRLEKLQRLDLKNNKITHLPADITRWNLDIVWEFLYGGKGLNLYGNPIESPPVEIVKQGMDAVRNYFAEMEKASTLLLQAKLLFVGSGEVGKTTLMRTLTETGFQLTTETIGKEESTHGIHIKPWKLSCPLQKDTEPSRDITLHTWDFGGQDIYLSTHQFFLTKRSLYIFVWEARREEQVNPFDYWLNVIKLLSDNSPVIVVMNKADKRDKPIDEAAYMDKFKNIRAFLRVSCLDRRGIDDLCRTISGVLGGMDHLMDKLPTSWQKIRTALEEEDKNYIDAARYYEICGRFGLEEQDRADHLGDYLHNLGAILRFRTDAHLKNTLILKPEWATEAVYKLIDTKRIIDKKGRFHFEDLEKTWDTDKYPVDKHHDLIRLMEKFELCFNFTGTTDYIVPELVPGQRPDIDVTDFQDKGTLRTLRFEYHYDFMPKGIVSRFIARNYYLIKDERFWQNGVELDFEESSALVIGDPPERKLRVWVKGQRKTELLAIIRNDLNHIHGTLNMTANTHYKEKIPCPCTQCAKKESPYMYDYPMLMRRWGKGRKWVECGDSDEEVSIGQLLQGIVREEPLKELDYTKELLKASRFLQGKHKSLRAEEDCYTDFIAVILEARGLQVKIQDRHGTAQSGKSMGRPDMRIINPEGETQAIAEAFRLKGEHKTVTREHLEKMFNYDATGCEVNYVLVYVEHKDFGALWKWYKKYVNDITFEHPLQSMAEQEQKNNTTIRVLEALHTRAGKPTTVYHIFIELSQE